jgi:hypothetical protein
MSAIAAFDEQGRCKYVCNGAEGAADLSAEPAIAEVVDATDPNSIWFDFESSKVMARTQFPVSVSTNKIDRIPVGTAVYVGSESMVVNEGSIEFDVEYPQTVRAVLMHVRHMDKTVEVPCEVQG